MAPRISVIVPVYKVERYLDTCVQSIFAQTYTDFELILVDDGSPDCCGDLCDAYAKEDARVRVIHKENGGLSSARNVGLEICIGEYVAFVDSDDWLAPSYLERLLIGIEEPGVDISVCGYIPVDEEGAEVAASLNLVPKFYTPAQAIETVLYERDFDTSAHMKLYKRSLFSDMRFTEGILFEDFDVLYRLFARCERIYYIGACLYFYRIRSGSIMTSEFSSAKLELVAIAKRILDFVDADFPEIHSAAVYRYVVSVLATLRGLVLSNEQDKEEIQRMVSEVRAYKREFLADPNASDHKKISLRCASLGAGAFRCMSRMRG
ncbi:MAG: glycosyltransferase [Actinobacteria bacterium]|nr:glycosyltransferase [Actinomycetota bacterium]